MSMTNLDKARQQIEDMLIADQQKDELHTMQLAAISTASAQNTPTTIKDRITRGSPYCTQAYLDTCAAVDREMALRNALVQSLILQSHYAKLLNMHDDGGRIAFGSAAAWMERLRELKGAKHENG